MHVCTAYDTMRVPVEGETDLCVLCAKYRGERDSQISSHTCMCMYRMLKERQMVETLRDV